MENMEGKSKDRWVNGWKKQRETRMIGGWNEEWNKRGNEWKKEGRTDGKKM